MRGTRPAYVCTLLALAGLLLWGCGDRVGRNIEKLGSSNKDERDEAFVELMLAKGSAVGPLIEALADASRPDKVRADIAEALFRMYVRESDPRIIPALIAGIDDTSPAVRSKVAIALADAEAKDAITPLLEQLSVEADSQVRADLLTAVEILGGWRIVQWRRDTRALIVEGGETLSAEQRQRLVEVLKRMSEEEKTEELRHQAQEFLLLTAHQHVQEAHKHELKADLASAEAEFMEARALAAGSPTVDHYLARFYFENGWPDKGLAMLKDLGRVLYAKRLSKAPTIDGDLSDQAWKQASKITQFYPCIFRMRIIPAEGESEAYVGYVGENLYIAVKGYEESTKDLTARFTQRDDNCWLDDCGEIYLDTNHDYSTFYQIAVNSLATIADYSYGGADEQGKAWNGSFQAAAQVEEKFWAFEIQIPFKEVTKATPKKGTVWGFNVARVRIAHKGEHDQWVPTHGAALRPELFGFLIFD